MALERAISSGSSVADNDERDDGNEEAVSEGVAAYLAGLPADRRAVVERFCRVIEAAVPHLDVRMWDYGGGLVGYGTYRYRTGSGIEGDWFALGVGDRKRHVSLYSNATRDGTYLLDHYRSRLPGAKVLRSCINVTEPELLDDDVVTELARETGRQFEGQYLRDL